VKNGLKGSQFLAYFSRIRSILPGGFWRILTSDLMDLKKIIWQPWKGARKVVSPERNNSSSVVKPRRAHSISLLMRRPSVDAVSAPLTAAAAAGVAAATAAAAIV
jgi:hypothetical protein